jgi:hypothetical protein
MGSTKAECKEYYRTHREEMKRKRLSYYYLHHAQQRAKQTQYKAKLRQSGRCSCCGVPLVQGEKISCVNCGGTIKQEFNYAKDLQRAS